MIPYAKQSIDQNDLDAVSETLRSDWLTQGPKVAAFEHCLRDFCASAHCIATNNATAALHLACLALDVGPGDLVLTTPITFVATANAAKYCGAEVDFVDIDKHTWCLDPLALEHKLNQLKSSGKRVKVLIVVHFGGLSCDMEPIARLAKAFDFKVIEDASHALGARYLDRPVGNGDHSDITVFSFHPVKMITTGEGGALLTNDARLYERARMLSSHGLIRESTQFVLEPETDWFGEWAYQQTALGFNFRITDFQCALGITQLNKLPQWVERRNELVRYYHTLLADTAIGWQRVPGNCFSSYHLFVVQLPHQISRRAVFKQMREKGIGVNVHYIPVHTQPYYQQLGFKIGQFPVAEHYYRHTLTLPLYPGLSESAVASVVQALKEACYGG